jgi:hypothetical protein
MARRLERGCKKASGWMDQVNEPEAPAPLRAQERAAAYFPTSQPGQMLGDLVAALKAVPRESRGEVASRLSALALAPDSIELLQDLCGLLQGAAAGIFRKQAAA